MIDALQLEEVTRCLRSRVAVKGRAVPRSTLRERMAELHVQAVSVAVLEHGDVATRAWGADPTALFQAASISKPVSAIAAVRLAADGVFDIDRPVNELLGSWQLPDGDGVTVRKILTHSAGLTVHGFPGYAVGEAIPTASQILDGQKPANTEAVRVAQPPGESFRYSGGGFTIMQLLLEDATGEPFAELMRRLVLEPLGMRTSTFDQPLPEDRRGAAAPGHDAQGTSIAGLWHVHPEQAAAGLWTNPAELAAVAAEMLRPGLVLDERTRDDMLTPQVDEHRGLGWALDGGWFHHGGSNVGYRCHFLASVVHERAVVVMTNGDGGGTLCADIAATVAEVFGWPDYLQGREAVDLDVATLDAIAGTYEVQPGFDLSIRRVGDVLTSSIPGLLAECELYASSPTDLFRIDVDASIRWSGEVLEIEMGGSSIVARRRAPQT